MPTEAQIIDALRPVEDPELHRSIVDLGMVRGVGFEGERVRVTIALTVAGCPLRAEITNRVSGAVEALPGVTGVELDFTVMTDEERQALAQRLRAEGGEVAGADGAAPKRVNPFTDSRTRVLAIASGKGGVGKSSVTTHLAGALAQA